ncbi:MAG: glycosyltransferase family 2 protein [Eubacterium sp.]|nr:glycosyltransferase family 2 protein [Eubacterium sp.]
MKYITFTVPCYNSASYMERCIHTLLAGGDLVEIIIVDDGSTDCTGEIADHYAKDYPDIVKVIHQENGGHGAGVNAGLAAATGRYFKVVDSDDWLDKDDLQMLLQQICCWEATGAEPDLIICNYLYDHLYEHTVKPMAYRNVFRPGRICSFEDSRWFGPSQYLVMHALWYRTEVLRRSGVKLPRHTFYVDNLFANQPLPYVETLCYLDLDIYHYFLGREDQSVNEKVLMRRIDQQIRVTKLVALATDLEKLSHRQPKLARYLIRNISIMMSISCIHLLLIGTPQAKRQREDLWHYIRVHNPKLYHYLKYKTLSGFTYLPGGKLGDVLTLSGYRAAKHIYQFN